MLLLHGLKDSLIPPIHSQALFTQAGTLDKRLVICPDANHCNFHEPGDTILPIAEFLAYVDAARLTLALSSRQPQPHTHTQPRRRLGPGQLSGSDGGSGSGSGGGGGGGNVGPWPWGDLGPIDTSLCTQPGLPVGARAGAGLGYEGHPPFSDAHAGSDETAANSRSTRANNNSDNSNNNQAATTASAPGNPNLTFYPLPVPRCYYVCPESVIDAEQEARRKAFSARVASEQGCDAAPLACVQTSLADALGWIAGTSSAVMTGTRNATVGSYKVNSPSLCNAFLT